MTDALLYPWHVELVRCSKVTKRILQELHDAYNDVISVVLDAGRLGTRGLPGVFSILQTSSSPLASTEQHLQLCTYLTQQEGMLLVRYESLVSSKEGRGYRQQF